MFILQVIGGSAAKKYGGKNILTLAVFLWSLSTFITPFFAHSIYALIALRVILGVGEGLGELSFRFKNQFFLLFYSFEIILHQDTAVEKSH
jgi:MFS family permease